MDTRDFKLVNLIVGKNNTGKTDFLRAFKKIDNDIVLAPGITDSTLSLLLDKAAKTNDVSSVVRETFMLFFPNGDTEPFYLNALGGGLSEMLKIAYSIILAKDNMILIDEIGYNLHYNLQQPAWALIFTWAKKYNVRIFATTQNIDVIKGFHCVWQYYLNDATFTRFNYNKSHTKFSYETLSDCLDSGVDPR